LKQEALDRILWRTRFRRGCGPDVRKTTHFMNGYQVKGIWLAGYMACMGRKRNWF